MVTKSELRQRLERLAARRRPDRPGCGSEQTTEEICATLIAMNEAARELVQPRPSAAYRGRLEEAAAVARRVLADLAVEP